MKYFFVLIIGMLILSACSGYSPSNKDVVNSHGDIKNIEFLDKFINDVIENKTANVRVVNYTIEGDPIIHDLKFANGKLLSKIDTREDDFGDKYVDESMCENIEITNKEEQTIYHLVGCENEKQHNNVLVINN
ncbi:DUF4362 domain-containing protein [Sutcliffiella cohnii]